MEFLKKMAKQALSVADPEHAVQACLDEICSHMRWPIGHLYLRNGDDPEILDPSPIWHLDGKGDFSAMRKITRSYSVGRGAGLPGRVLETGEYCWTQDLARDAQQSRGRDMTELGMLAGYAFPIHAGKELLGVMEFFSREVRELDAALRETMAELGALIGETIGRFPNYGEMRKTELRLAGMLEISGDAVIWTDAQGIITLANRGAEIIFGYGREELAGKPLEMLMPKKFRGAHAAHVEAFSESRINSKSMNERGDIFALRKDGEQFPAEASISKREYKDTLIYTAILRDISARRRDENKLRESEERFRQLVEGSVQGILIHKEFKCVFANQAAADLFGFDSPEEMLALASIEEYLHPSKSRADAPGEVVGELMRESIVGDREGIAEQCGMRKDGQRIRYQSSLREIDWRGEPATQCAVVDVTDRAALEDKLRQAQKMEAVGQLAGGIAHDFNNMLQVIRGFTSLTRTELGGDLDKATLYLNMVENAAESAANLTRQVLAFSRRQVLQPAAIEVNALLSDLMNMVQRLIGENIELKLIPGPGLEPIFADPGMVKQALLNLCVNARDSMAEGGRLTITTSACVVDADFADSHEWAKAGRYVLIEVKDSGEGIPAELQGRIFEPFFSTKEVGEGTGLGLSMVYGIIMQHDGMVNVSSEPGNGSTFRVYLPVSGESILTTLTESAPDSAAGGNETILVAEDETMVLELTKELLEGQGYHVLCAHDGMEAVEVFDQHTGEIELVILDVVMPRMGGRNAFFAIRQIDTDVPVLFCTGYSSTAIDSEFLTTNQVRMIHKPIAPAELISTVRETLDRVAAPETPHNRAALSS